LRFPDDGVKGKKRYQDHLDLHFRQNLRNATASSTTGVGTMGKGYTRSWFIGKQDWISDVSRDLEPNVSSITNDKGKGRALSPSSGSVNTKVSAEGREAKLRASFVVIPPGDEAKPIRCPVCKEGLKAEFQEDDEEWVWRNAVCAKGKIYHATCYADALAANVARLRMDATGGPGRSRSATPDSSLKVEDTVDMKSVKASTPVPSPLAGTKRKADEVDREASRSPSATTSRSGSATVGGSGVIVKVEETDSPRPMKKMALGQA